MNYDLDEFEKKVKEFIKNQNIYKSKIEEFIANNKTERIELEKVERKAQKSFDDLINQAHNTGYSNIDLYDIATVKEINEANQLLSRYYSEFTE